MSSGIRVVLGVLGGVLLIFVLMVAFGGGGFFGPGQMMGQGGMMGQGWGPGGMMGQGGLGAWWMLVMMLVPLLFLGGLIALIAWAVIHLTSGRRGESTLGTTREDSAEEILRQRFARGEIDAKEYEERRRTLGGSV